MSDSAVAQLPIADARIAEILEGARRAFSEKGFDGASMQDLARAAGMSVGNFYRYFPSKAAIVEAFITADLVEVEGHFDELVRAPNPMESLRAALHARVKEDICDGHGQVWAEISAAALRKPEIGVITQGMESKIIEKLTTVFAVATSLSTEVAALRYTPHARLIVMLIKGASMTLMSKGHGTDELTALVIRTIDRTLDEIASDALKG